jgi:hypothetical protein
MRSERARMPGKEKAGRATPQELVERIGRASLRPDGAGNIRRLLTQGADPKSLVLRQKRFLRHDPHCWLMKVAQMADAELLGLAWEASRGSESATPEKLMAAIFICAWRGDAATLGAWAPKAWKEVKGSDSLARQGAFEALRMRNHGALAVFGSLAPNFVHENLGPENCPPMLSSAALNCPEAVGVLLKMGADPERRDELGRTALLAAAAHCCAPAVRLLSEVGDPRAVDASGEGLMHWRPMASGALAHALDEALARAEVLELREDVAAVERGRAEASSPKPRMAL